MINVVKFTIIIIIISAITNVFADYDDNGLIRYLFSFIIIIIITTTLAIYFVIVIIIAIIIITTTTTTIAKASNLHFS